MSWVLDHSDATLGARLVLLAIANHANNAGENSWQSVETLAKASRLSERQTRYALRKLEEIGEIEKVGRTRQGTHVYRLPKMAQQALDEGADSAGADIAPRQDATLGGQSSTRDHEETAPDSYREPSGEPTAPAPRPRDEGWEVFLEQTGVEPGELSEKRRGDLNGMLATLRRLTPGLTPDGIRARAREWGRRYPETSLTPETLVRRWAELGHRKGSAARSVPTPRDGHAFVGTDELCKSCGEGEYRHVRSVVDQREDRNAAAELAARAHLAVEDQAPGKAVSS
jgi:hypothetical protein